MPSAPGRGTPAIWGGCRPPERAPLDRAIAIRSPLADLSGPGAMERDAFGREPMTREKGFRAWWCRGSCS